MAAGDDQWNGVDWIGAASPPVTSFRPFSGNGWLLGAPALLGAGAFWSGVVTTTTPWVSLQPSTLLFWLIILYFAARFFCWTDHDAVPIVTLCDESSGNFVSQLIGSCPVLREPYRAPRLWGRSGHVQTAVYGLLGHRQLKRTAEYRGEKQLADGTTVTWDVWNPCAAAAKELSVDCTLALTPGIANHSQSNYIRTCVHAAAAAGFRVAVLNHVGALPEVPITGNRIFSYGGTEDLNAMMKSLAVRYSQTKFILVGFSMGANITTRWAATADADVRDRVIFGLSVCQGYCARAAAPFYHDWTNARRLYNYIITENVKRLLRRNYERAVLPHSDSGLVDEERLWRSSSIVALDDVYARPLARQLTLDHFYRSISCLHLIPTLKMPFIFVNAEDDPLIPEDLWRPVQELARKQSNIAHVLVRHGGHLGFLEGSSFAVNSLTFLDRTLIQLARGSLEATTKH